MLRQHKLNGNMVFAEGSPNLMQRLPRFPSTPHLIPLLLSKLEPPPKSHKHHLIEKDLYQMVLHRPVELATSNGIYSITKTADVASFEPFGGESQSNFGIEPFQ